MGRGGIKRRKPRRRQPRRKTASTAPLEFEGTALGRYSGLALGPFARGLARARGRRPARRWDPVVVMLVAIIILVLVGPLILFLLRSA